MSPASRVKTGGEKFCREIFPSNAVGAAAFEKIARVQSRSERPSVAWSTASGADVESDAMGKLAGRRPSDLVRLSNQT